MSRGRVRKTNKGQFTEDQMKNAVRQVIQDKLSLREAAERNGVKFQTLARYVKKKKSNPTVESLRMKPKYDSRKIFSEAEEHSLCDYILQCTRMCYGKSTKEVRQLAYELAVANSIKIPNNWEREKKAGIDWLQSFMKRHPNLSIRQPEACSLSRATSFNQHNVSLFFNNLQKVFQRSEKLVDPSRIFNLDETATTTVHKPKKIVAQRGMKQVSKCTSAERGTLVTTCCMINAAGNTLPPVMIFPRKKFKENMIFGAPPGTLGLVSPSGWMTTELFVKVMKHFIKKSSSSKENPSLLVMDNHESHISVATLNLAKDNGVTIITLPPHCSNKLQPLDVTVFYSFKAFYNASVDSWLLNHPGVPLNIYGIAGCVGQAFQRSMTPMNITAGFRKTGIFPFDRNIFTAEDFLLSKVTDRALMISPVEGDRNGAVGSRTLETANDVDAIIPRNQACSETKKVSNRNEFISPEELIGFPQANALTTKQRKPRRKRISAVLTDTPDKEEEERKELEKMRKKSLQNSHQTRKQKIKDLCPLESSDDEEFMEQESEVSEYEIEVEEEQEFNFEPVQRKAEVNEFVLVEFSTKRKVYYIAKVTENQTDEIHASCFYIFLNNF